MILVIALNKNAYDLYRKKHGLSPIDAKWVREAEQLRGYRGVPVVAIGNWYKGDSQRDAHHFAMAAGLRVTVMTPIPAYAKYGAKKTEYNGLTYASKFEAQIAQELDLRMRAGEFVKVEAQFRIPLYVYLADGKTVNIFAYVCDFRCEKPDGTYLLVEAKGFRTDMYRVKRKMLELIWLPDHLNYSFEEIGKENEFRR